MNLPPPAGVSWRVRDDARVILESGGGVLCAVVANVGRESAVCACMGPADCRPHPEDCTRRRLHWAVACVLRRMMSDVLLAVVWFLLPIASSECSPDSQLLGSYDSYSRVALWFSYKVGWAQPGQCPVLLLGAQPRRAYPTCACVCAPDRRCALCFVAKRWPGAVDSGCCCCCYTRSAHASVGFMRPASSPRVQPGRA